MKRLFVILGCVALLFPAHSFASTKSGFKKGQYVSVNTNDASLRGGPSTGFKTLWKLCLYWPVKVLHREGDWYRVCDYEGDTGWLHRSLLSDVATLVFKKDKVDVLSAPEENSPLVWKAEKGYAVRIIDRKGDWFHVEDEEGDRGWVKANAVWGNKQFPRTK